MCISTEYIIRETCRRGQSPLPQSSSHSHCTFQIYTAECAKQDNVTSYPKLSFITVYHCMCLLIVNHWWEEFISIKPKGNPLFTKTNYSESANWLNGWAQKVKEHRTWNHVCDTAAHNTPRYTIKAWSPRPVMTCHCLTLSILTPNIHCLTPSIQQTGIYPTVSYQQCLILKIIFPRFFIYTQKQPLTQLDEHWLSVIYSNISDITPFFKFTQCV